MDVAGNAVVASLLEEVVAVKGTFAALLLTFLHRGISRHMAAHLAMHGLPSEGAKAMAVRMRDAWPAATAAPGDHSVCDVRESS